MTNDRAPVKKINRHHHFNFQWSLLWPGALALFPPPGKGFPLGSVPLTGGGTLDTETAVAEEMGLVWAAAAAADPEGVRLERASPPDRSEPSVRSLRASDETIAPVCLAASFVGSGRPGSRTMPWLIFLSKRASPSLSAEIGTISSAHDGHERSVADKIMTIQAERIVNPWPLPGNGSDSFGSARACGWSREIEPGPSSRQGRPL